MSLFAVVAIMFALSLEAFAQDAPAPGTRIQNQASAAFRDSTGKNYSAVSNMVAFTVAKVAGLTITPDEQTSSLVLLGQTSVDFTFRVTNTGNFTDQVRFLANGASIQVTGPATVANASIAPPLDTDIYTNTADVLHSLESNSFVDVIVNLTVNADAVAGSIIQVFLGDATTGTNFDNVAADNSANEVRTVSTGAANGSREARGDISATVVEGGKLRVNLTVPPGPVALGTNITYTVNACNDGTRDLSRTIIIAPIPIGTRLASASSLPAGTNFTTEPLSVEPFVAFRRTSAVAPSDLSTVTRIVIPIADRLAPGNCSPDQKFSATITATDINTPIYAIVDAFSADSTIIITDQSGDNVASKGDNNANFDEPILGAPASPTQGFQQPTQLMALPDVLIGPNGAPNATGPTDTNDDYTNLSVPPGTISNGRTTTPRTVAFTNTVQNNGSADDTFTFAIDGNNSTLPDGATIDISH